MKCVLFVLLCLVPNFAFAYQLFEDETQHIDPTYKNFTYYISSTYYDFFADANIDITEIHVQGIRSSLDILEAKAATVGIDLKFTYGGTYDIADALGPDGTRRYQDMDFDGKFYFDFTSVEMWGRQYVPTASADGRSARGTKNTGGIIRFNSDYLNFIHPEVNMSHTVIHEVLHVLGLDHSTTSSAIMAYTEFWYPTLSADDLMGLRQIYDVGSGTELKVSILKEGSPAPGVEVVVFDVSTGVGTQVIAGTSGAARIRHLPPGDYKVAVREETPTGPCFENPTRGFLTTLYGSGSNLNSLENASTISLVANQTIDIAISVIPRVKKFDCHYARATAMADQACNGNSFASPSGAEDCWLHMTKPGMRYTPMVENDLSVLSHKTDTDILSGAHPNLSVVPVGTSPGFTVHKAELLPEVGNFTRVDLEIHENAPDGIQVAMCTDGTENALIGSLIEVQDFGGAFNNKIMLPNLSDQLGAVRGPRNYGTYLRAADANPGSGTRPANDSAAWQAANRGGFGGVGNVPAKIESEEEKDKDKKWYQSCGSIELRHKTPSSSMAILLLLVPCILCFFLDARFRVRNTRRET
jgi:hypothetical protein